MVILSLSGGDVYGIDLTIKSTQKISDTSGNLSGVGNPGGVLDDNDKFGFSLQSLGDLDGDGIIDLTAGAINDDDGGTNRGAVYILFLAPQSPNISSITASDPDAGDAVYGNGDTITVVFSEATNQPLAATKSNLDGLFTFSQDLGDNYTGVWTSSSTLTITIVDSTTSTPPAVGELTLTVIADGTDDLTNAAGTSLPSVAESPNLAGDFGPPVGPLITSLVASDPDNGDIVYGNSDSSSTSNFGGGRGSYSKSVAPVMIEYDMCGSNNNAKVIFYLAASKLDDSEVLVNFYTGGKPLYGDKVESFDITDYVGGFDLDNGFIYYQYTVDFSSGYDKFFTSIIEKDDGGKFLSHLTDLSGKSCSGIEYPFPLKHDAVWK